VDADTFRIWKGTKHPAEAFTVLAYLIDTGINKLVVGTADKPPAYGAIPSIPSLRQPWVDAKKAQFPYVQNWDVMVAGLNYADVPSAEAFMPNFNEAWARTVTFASLMGTNGSIDLNAEMGTLQSDLTTIFNK
jgi:multiple sugar transport system substrate-binding protein